MTAKTTGAKTRAKKPETAKASSKVAKEPSVVAKAPSKHTASASKTATKHMLRLWNVRLGAVLLVRAVAVVVAGDSSTVPVTTQYLAKDALATESAGGANVLAPATRHLMDVRVSWLIAKFLVIAAGMYLLAATIWRKRYEAWLDRGVNKLRWAGFGLAGGVAIAAIAMLGGMSDLATLLLIFGSVVLAGAFAAALELLGPDRRLGRLLAAGAVAGLVLPLFGFAANVVGVSAYNGSLPLRMYLLYAVVTVWFAAIALATHFRVKQRGRWADAVYAEKAFMLLGFAAAVVLASQIFLGGMQT
jgi:hypothetical protein